MLYLGEDGSGHCPQTIAECTFQTGISYGLIKTSFPQKNSFCCNNEEWLFQTYVDIFVNGKKLPYNLYMCQAPLGLCGGEKIYEENFFDTKKFVLVHGMIYVNKKTNIIGKNSGFVLTLKMNIYHHIYHPKPIILEVNKSSAETDVDIAPLERLALA